MGYLNNVSVVYLFDTRLCCCNSNLSKMCNMFIRYDTRQMAIAKGLLLLRCELFLYTKAKILKKNGIEKKNFRLKLEYWLNYCLLN